MIKSSASVSVAQFLSDRSAPCPNCDYELRNLESDRCPECGELLVLQVGRVERISVAWMLGLIGLSIALGSSLGSLVGLISGIIMMGGLGDILNYLLWPLIYSSGSTVFWAAMVWLWCKFRLPFHRRSLAFRRWLAVVCMASLLFNIFVPQIVREMFF